MSKFRKKPVVIEAHQFGGTVSSADAIIAWAGMEPRPNESDPVTLTVDDNEGTFRDRIERPEQFGPLVIHTLEGDMTAQEGDWIIKGVKGEFYPCKPDIFAATYEPVGPASPVRPSDHADSSRTHNAASTGSPVRNPTQEAGIAAKKIVEWRALAEQISANVAGLEDQHYFGDAGRLDAKARQLEACADDLEAARVVPVRDPAPPDQKAFSESEAVLLDLIAQYGQASFTEGRHFDADPEYDAPQDERSSGLWRAILPAVRGVRDPSPPEPTDREIGLRSALNAALVDLRIFRGVDDHFVQALEKLVEQTGVRGAGVVEPQDCGLDRQHGPHRFVRPDGTFAACAGGPLPNDGFPDGPVRGALVALYLQGSHGHDPESLGRCVDKCMAKLAPYLASGVVPSAPSPDNPKENV